jgi:serine protease Do
VAPRALEILGGRGSQIGVTIRDVEDDDAKAGKLAAQGGVVIEEVAEDSPASKAGMKKGDIVVEFDGERVRSVRQFTRLVQETPAGRKAQAAVVRDGQRINVTVEPRESNGLNVFGDLESARVLRDFGRDFPLDIPAPPARPARPATPAPPAPPAAPAFPDIESFVWRTGNGLGITVGDLSDQLAAYFGVKDGVLVTSIADNSAASKAGIKAGDIITSFNGTDVAGPSDLRRRIQRLQDGDEFTVGVVRDKKALTLKGKAETTRSRRTYRSES